ncbi:MAG TPA: hypothetical protein G4O15_11830 [Dehalococcoidia bacterium]|nr:hypothetical protein [Dehalococcoidia bacterium]
MADMKYGNYVKQLAFTPGRGGANAKELVFVSGEDMGGFEFNFIIGVYDQTGDWAPGAGAHNHPFDELLLFFGYDDNDMSYLGSDMELSLGKEWEPHKFSVPTVGVAPQGFPHCPLVTEKVYKPFGHFHLALSATYSGERVAKEGETEGNKYSHLMKPMKIEQGEGGSGAVQFVRMSGDELEGLNIHFIMGLLNQPGVMARGMHIHPYDEAIVFFGHNTDDLSYLGAEISLEIGNEREKHTFDKPTVIAIPRGVPHGMLTCNKVDRPYSGMVVGLGPKNESSPVD